MLCALKASDYGPMLLRLELVQVGVMFVIGRVVWIRVF